MKDNKSKNDIDIKEERHMNSYFNLHSISKPNTLGIDTPSYTADLFSYLIQK